MTEAESEVELGAAEEESTTEAAPQGPGIATKSTSTPGAAPLGASSSPGGAPGFSTIYPTATAFPGCPECMEDLPAQQLPYRHALCPNRSTVLATSKITSNNSIQQPCWLAGFHRDTIIGHNTSHFG